MESKFIGVHAQKTIQFQDNRNQKPEKQKPPSKMPSEGEKKIYVSIRFDCFNNLWAMDTDGIIYIWNSPLQSTSSKSLNCDIETIQKPDSAMIFCIGFLKI